MAAKRRRYQGYKSADADALVKLSDPPTAMEESAWLGAFHKIRANIMNNYPEWKDNNYRVATYDARTGKVDTGAGGPMVVGQGAKPRTVFGDDGWKSSALDD